MFSIILPTLNEADHLRARLAQIYAQTPQAQIIVADGGSTDGTPEAAAQFGAQVISPGRGRGRQCRAGAALAAGEILLFLHADTILPPDAFEVLTHAFANPAVQIGSFRLRFDHPHPVLRLYASFSRFDCLLTRFGDQGIAVRREFYEDLGGFPDWPLFEDVGFLRRARRRAALVSFPAQVTTSARRYLQNGIIRQQLQNLWLMIQFLGGVSPEILAQKYARNHR